MKNLILASTSVYRQNLLKKTGLAFSVQKPIYDEREAQVQALARGLKPIEVAELLSRGKGEQVWKNNSPDKSIVIAGDQLVNLGGEILGKSGDFENAKIQLLKMNGRSHELITAISLFTSEKIFHFNHVTTLAMKKLSEFEIENYLRRDQPYDCAGSYKIEESGLVLFEKIDCSDFTAIQGLPLLWLTNHLKELGYEFFKG